MCVGSATTCNRNRSASLKIASSWKQTEIISSVNWTEIISSVPSRDVRPALSECENEKRWSQPMTSRQTWIQPKRFVQRSFSYSKFQLIHILFLWTFSANWSWATYLLNNFDFYSNLSVIKKLWTISDSYIWRHNDVSIKKKFFFHKRKALSGIPTRVQVGGII